MIQHLLVAIIFALCLWFVIRRIAHTVNRAKNNDPRCLTCNDAHCPLRHTREASQCTCQGTKTTKKRQKEHLLQKKAESMKEA